MFEPDGEFATRARSELVDIAQDRARSVVVRGRSILEVGRRAHGDPELANALLKWLGEAEFQRLRWVGAATLAWIAAAAFGYSQHDPTMRERLQVALSLWDPEELGIMLAWASGEDWFSD